MSYDLQTVAAGRAETVAAAQGDLNFFASLALGAIFKYLFPKEFLAIWQILTTAIKATKGKTRLALGIPRGFAKTTLLKIYVCWLILFTDRRFILIVCNTQELAENFLMDVFEILGNDNIIAIFGRWNQDDTSRDTLKKKNFFFRGRNITVACAGCQTSLRGLNIKFVRPDVVIMDDMQSREQSESTVEAMRSLTWMLGTLMKAVDPERCLYVFIGNMYPFPGCILKKLKYNPAWVSFICGAILEDGRSLWPELKPVEELITELENDTSMGHPEIFYSEVMNDEEAGTRSGVDISAIVGIPARDLPENAEAGFIIIDPSLGKKKSDNIAIGAVLLYDRIPVLVELINDKFTQGEIIRKAIAMALKWNIPAIVVEGVAYQATLAYWFQVVMTQVGITGIVPLLVFPHGAKNSRIIAGLKQLVKGEVKLHERVRSQVVNQITAWNPLKQDNVDDILDIIAYIGPVIAQYGNAILMLNITDGREDRDIWSTIEEELQLAF